MTLVRIDKKDRDAVAYALSCSNLNYRFYTMENNENMLQLEIDCDSTILIWYLARKVENLCQQEFNNY